MVSGAVASVSVVPPSARQGGNARSSREEERFPAALPRAPWDDPAPATPDGARAQVRQRVAAALRAAGVLLVASTLLAALYAALWSRDPAWLLDRTRSGLYLLAAAFCLAASLLLDGGE